MRLECLANSGAELPEQYLDAVGGYSTHTILPLGIGTRYTVFAVTLRRGGVWYYLHDDRQLEYPVWYPAPLFKVLDGRLSRFWVMGFHEAGVRDGDAVLAIPRWASEPFLFYDALSDGNTDAIEGWRRYRKLIELEFANGDAGAVASDIGDGWLQCARCNDAWQTTATGEQLRCPHCGLAQKNPRLLEGGR